MSRSLPLITVIIAARVDQSEVVALSGLLFSSFPREQYEVLLVRGRQPSRQRNLAAREARGEFLYFLDDDSMIGPDALERISQGFTDPEVAVVGGPSLCPEAAPPLQQAFAALMGSWLAFGPSCARYRQKGAVRATSEKEFILCNMAIRRTDFDRLNGFDEALYPNEENVLLDQLEHDGRRLWYDPGLIVYRYPRDTVTGFLWMLFRYGRGRGEQVRLHPTTGSLLNFIPALWGIYLLVLLALWGFSAGSLSFLQSPIVWPGWVYVAVLLGFTAKAFIVGGVVEGVLAAPLLGAAHLFYGIGLWKGLVVGASPRDDLVEEDEITVERVRLAGRSLDR
ncbi:MAG: hypothetical protein M2R45_04644 [Verrucomicrobia subdivision 3 bacterium]|nr:hypothetical protein [Limisphaerales bacterium]MCS1417136.1 hypothetical protein [Limisphaerales bacterium]